MSTDPADPIVAIGEVLWDLMADGRRAGGAPFNFAFHCQQLGHRAVIVSRVGDDDLGRALRAEVRRLGMSDEYLQTDPVHPTGTVRVAVGADGQPDFVIADDVAWDHVEWNSRIAALADTARAVCCGTLAQRRPGTREAIRMLRERSARTSLAVCDINLRPPFVTEENIVRAIHGADWLKLNEQEAPDVLRAIGEPSEDSAPAADAGHLVANAFLATGGGRLVCITRGAHGCIVRTAETAIELDGIRVPVVDAVGAGDAFTAALLTQHLEGQPLAVAARFANAYAAVVASKPGGTPFVERAEVEALL